MATRPDNLIFAVDDLPPAGKLVLLGLQQVCLIAIYLVIEVIVIRAARAPHAVAQSAVG